MKAVIEGDNNFIIFNLISKKTKYLSYPFLKDESYIKDREFAFAKYIDDELTSLMQILENKNLLDKTIIVLCGLPINNSNIDYNSLKMPLLIYSNEIKKEKVIKNRYSHIDIMPSLIKLALDEDGKFHCDGKSIFDTDYILKDIIIEENRNIFFNRIRNISQDLYINKIRRHNQIIENSFEEQNIKSILSKKSYIRGDYKLNIIPLSNRIEYSLYDIEKDPMETIDIKDEINDIFLKMIDNYNEKNEKIFGSKIINGYLVK